MLSMKWSRDQRDHLSHLFQRGHGQHFLQLQLDLQLLLSLLRGKMDLWELLHWFTLTLVWGQHPVWRRVCTRWCTPHRDQQQHRQPCRPALPTLVLQHTNRPTSLVSISPQHRYPHFLQRDQQQLNPRREVPTNQRSSQLSLQHSGKRVVPVIRYSLINSRPTLPWLTTAPPPVEVTTTGYCIEIFIQDYLILL